MQTDDNREGIYEGVIACYLADYLDGDEFWSVIDGSVYADHETVLKYIEFVTVDSGFMYAWLDEDRANELVSTCPSLEEHLKRKGHDTKAGPVTVYTDKNGNRCTVDFS
jgi:hypothetical protein|tara:strand:- start:67 stop:393 length:327 start_codon:yes stop_codon:yes gene_type:complete